MFGIGWSELAVIFCVAIIFINPKDLPALFRKLGKLYAQVKKAYDEIVATKDQFVKDIEEAAALEEKKEEQETAGKAVAESATAQPDEAPGVLSAEAVMQVETGVNAAVSSDTASTPLPAEEEPQPNAVAITEPGESSPFIHPSSVE